MLITLTLLFWTTVIFLIWPWYVVVGALLSLLLFNDLPTLSLRRLLLESLFWPAIIIKWLLKRKK